MGKVLIIKTGAAGDIVRTTILLNVLPHDITWLTADLYVPLFAHDHPRLKKVVPLSKATEMLARSSFDLVLSLEEDPACAAIAMQVDTRKFTGVFLRDNELSYTPDSASWFDMSLISEKGKTVANQLKATNRKSYQEHICSMAGYLFSGEPYCIFQDSNYKSSKRIIALETRAGKRWPNKSWSGYDHLKPLLEEKGFAVKMLAQKNNIREYLADISSCSGLISGDTLAMHVAMAYKKPCIAIFNCTSPEEIYAYPGLKKIVSPILARAYYKTTFMQDATSAIPVETVFYASLELFDNVKGSTAE